MTSTEATWSPGLHARAEVRPVPANPGDLLRGFRSGDLRFTESRHQAPISMHTHEHATITVLLEGVFEESYRGRLSEQHCLASSVLFRPPGEPHADRFGRDGALNLVIEIEPARLETLTQRTGVFAGVAQHRDQTLHLIARKMHREFAVADSATPLALEGLTLELLAAGSRAIRGTPGRHRGTLAAWLCRVRDCLHARFASRDLRIVELARLVDIHPVYLARAFRAQFGVSPAEYLRQLRLTWSAAALGDSSRSIAEIAMEAGFTDQSHFTRTFRRAFGETPGAYRRLAASHTSLQFSSSKAPTRSGA